MTDLDLATRTFCVWPDDEIFLCRRCVTKQTLSTQGQMLASFTVLKIDVLSFLVLATFTESYVYDMPFAEHRQ